MMALTEDLVRACAAEVAGTLQLTYQGLQLDLEPPFRRATMHELVQEATGAPLLLNRYEGLIQHPCNLLLVMHGPMVSHVRDNLVKGTIKDVISSSTPIVLALHAACLQAHAPALTLRQLAEQRCCACSCS